jgi:triphosphoribosyl-dephospho-CoA synthase
MSDPPTTVPLSVGQMASLAFLFEATAAKPGNVHRGSDFEDATFVDFSTSALLIGPIFDRAPQRRLGETVLDAVRTTHAAVGVNTNLGGLLLVAPLAMVPPGESLAAGVRRVLGGLNADDCRQVYEAIRLAQPGGLGSAAQADIHGEPPPSLLEAMRLAADRDLVARQYANGFAEVLGGVVPRLERVLARGGALQDAIVHVYLQTMHEFPDSLICRKCGPELAARAAALAGQVLSTGEPTDEAYREALSDLDFWLRADGHRRNPGTTADLMAAGLFAALRDGIITLPVRFYS